MNTFIQTAAFSDKVSAGALNTTKSAFRPSDIRLFSRPESLGCGLDGVNRKATRSTGFELRTSCPPADRLISASGFQSQPGAKTMPQGTPTTTPTTAPHEATNQATLPRYQHPGTLHPERIVTPPSPAKSIDLAMRFILIGSSLTRASNALRMGSLSQSLGATMARVGLDSDEMRHFLTQAIDFK
jgi:hypothetical protein